MPLALALALSGKGGRVATLFIDEGFGSLDALSLDLAIDALESLRSQGRQVGVISHVEAMKDRIPTRIAVRKQGGGKSIVDSVEQINTRKSEGFDDMIDAFLDAPGDVLIDLPAAGSDITSAFLTVGNAAGTVDLESLLAEIGARLVILFVIDQGRDALVALDAEYKPMPKTVTDWLIVRNHRTNAPFGRFEKAAEKHALGNEVVLDMPELDRRVVEALVDAKTHTYLCRGKSTQFAWPHQQTCLLDL